MTIEERVSRLEGQVETLLRFVESAIDAKHSGVAALQQSPERLLPPIIIDALTEANIGRDQKIRTAAWTQAAKEWRDAKRAGTADDQKAKQIAARIHAGERSLADLSVVDL